MNNPGTPNVNAVTNGWPYSANPGTMSVSLEQQGVIGPVFVDTRTWVGTYGSYPATDLGIETTSPGVFRLEVVAERGGLYSRYLSDWVAIP